MTNNKHVCVLMANGFEEIEAITVIDILRRANIKVTMAAVETLQVKGAHGIELLCDNLLANIQSSDVDMIVLPGGMPGSLTLAKNIQAQAFIKEVNLQKKWIGAICAALLALHSAGVLGNNYTCYPSIEEKISGSIRQPLDVVVDNNIITSQGPATAMKFALQIVKTLCEDAVYIALQTDLLFSSSMSYYDQIDVAVTVCDLEGVILWVNDKSRKTFSNWGDNLVGQSLAKCHKPASMEKIKEIMTTRKANTYTIEKNGVKKVVHQTPWYKDGNVAGLVEFSTELPNDMAHFVRT